MAQQNLNIGTNPNDNTGDTLRNSMIKIQDNFTDWYTNAITIIDGLVGNTDWQTKNTQEEIEDIINNLISSGTHDGIVISYDDNNNTLSFSLTGEEFTSSEKNKLSFLNITQNVDLDQIETDVNSNNNKRTYPLTDENKVSNLPADQNSINNLKADKNNVLELNNTTPFTPNSDHEPATKKYVDDEIVNAGGYNDESAQDAIGNILTNSSEIEFNYDDNTPSITATIATSSIDETKLDSSVNNSLNLADSATQPGDLGNLASKNTVSSVDIDDNSVTLSKIQDIASQRILGRNTAGNGNPETLTPSQLRTIINVESGAEVNPTDSEIETSYNNQVAQVSAGEKTAGTETSVRRFSPDDVKDMIDTHASGGGSNPTHNPTNYTASDNTDIDDHLGGIDSVIGNILSSSQTKKDINANYTLVASDFTDNVIIQHIGTNDITVTIPPNSTLGLTSDASVLIQAINTGLVTLVGGSGVTFQAISTDAQGQYSIIGATRDGIDNYYPLGDWKTYVTDPTYNPSNYTEVTSTLNGHLEGIDNVLANISGGGKTYKSINIGDWNMDSTSQLSIAHGLNSSEWKSITDLNVMIRNDADDLYKPFEDGVQGITVVTNFLFDHGIDIDDTNITLDRQTGGKFTGADYNGTGFSRGTITFYYTAVTLPNAPTLSEDSRTDTTVTLNWTSVTGATGYKVYKDNVLEATLGTVLTYQVTGLTASTEYDFNVRTIDDGVDSLDSNTVTVTTNAGGGVSGTELYTESSAIVLPSAGTEDATVGSWIASSGTIDINTSDFDTGSRSFERSPSFVGNNGYFYLRMPDATNGETYTVSFRYKLTTVSATGVNVFIEGFDSSQPTTQITDTSGQWQTFTNTGTGTSSQFADIEFTFTGTTVEADTLLIDSFSIIQHD